MPTSPSVNFDIVNNNVAQTVPSLGISCMLARTTKGPVNNPSEIIQGYSHFQRVFGEEVLSKDNTISPIQKALEGGSKLRIVRVAKETPGTISGEATAELFNYANGSSEYVNVIAKPLGNGDIINGSNTYKVKLQLINNEIVQLVVEDSLGNILESSNVFKCTINNNVQYLDAANLLSYARTSEYLTISVSSNVESVKDLDTFATWLATCSGQPNNGSKVALGANGETAASNSLELEVNTGEASDPTIDDWKNGFDSLLDYTDVYQVTCSNINHQPSSLQINTLHKYIADICNQVQEYTYYIEVPSKEGDLVMTPTKIIQKAKELQSLIGYSKYVAYFTGGLKYYNTIGVLADTDCIGPVMGLGDTCATNYGPWRSFAGMVNGIIPSAVGPVIKNYGSPARYAELNELAQNYLNVMVIKDTPSAGKSTMLWHLFTSNFVQNSEKFLAIVRLNLYIKKNLRPILEKYLEQPNIWSTWMDIYLEAKPILDNLIDESAISEYTWMGDQNASSYADLVVNNEADVRQGKYKIIFKYKDIVPMQEINITLYIDQASKSTSVTIE